MALKYGGKWVGHTDKHTHIEGRLWDKLRWLCTRCTKRKHFNLILVDGFMGYGKSNAAAICCNAVSFLTGRKYDNDHVFFSPEKMIDFAVNNQDQIIHFDESATIGLASEWQNKIQKKFIKMLYMGRKKRHFYFLCIPRFYKLGQPIIDCAIGLIHMYSPNEEDLGYFYYYNRKKLMRLYGLWNKKKVIRWKKFRSFRGKFEYDMYRKGILDEERYESEKDKAIAAITDTGEKNTSQNNLRYMRLRIIKMIDHLRERGITKTDSMKMLGITESTLKRWKADIENNNYSLNTKLNSDSLPRILPDFKLSTPLNPSQGAYMLKKAEEEYKKMGMPIENVIKRPKIPTTNADLPSGMG